MGCFRVVALYKIWLVFVFCFAGLLAQAQEWKRVLKFEGGNYDGGIAMALTPEEDVLVAGYYEDKGGLKLESADGRHQSFAANMDTFPDSHSTFFLSRYTAAGNLLWSVNALGERGISPRDITSDKQGNCIVTGSFTGIAIFFSTDGSKRVLRGMPKPPGNESAPLNLFLAKYSPTGKLLWLKLGTAREHSAGYEVHTDGQDNIYLRAYTHYGLLSFDSHTFIPGNRSDRHFNNFGLILVKYSPEGEEKWVTLGGNFHVQDMSVDAAGNSTIRGLLSERAAVFTSTGKLYEPTDPEPGTLYRCTMHLNSQGELEKIAPSFPALKQGSVYKAVQDKAGNYYALVMPESNYYDGHNYPLTWQGKTYMSKWHDIFVAKFDAQQNPIWITQFVGKADERPLDLVLDQDENVIVSGYFREHLKVQDITGDSIILTTSFGYQTLLLASFTPNGLLNWTSTGSNNFDKWNTPICQLALNSNNRLYITGQLNAPSKMGKHRVNSIGEKGDSDPWWTHPVDYQKCPDGYMAMIDLKEKVRYDVVLNLSLNYKQAARIIEKSLALAKAGLDKITPEPAITQTIAFTPAPPGTETSSNSTALDALVYPNPAGPGHPEITSQITLPEAAMVRWTLLDPNGNQLWQVSRQYAAGVAVYQFSVRNLPAGVYLLVIETGNSRTVKRLVLQ